jgi:hypothetical protein
MDPMEGCDERSKDATVHIFFEDNRYISDLAMKYVSACMVASMNEMTVKGRKEKSHQTSTHAHDMSIRSQLTHPPPNARPSKQQNANKQTNKAALIYNSRSSGQGLKKRSGASITCKQNTHTCRREPPRLDPAAPYLFIPECHVVIFILFPSLFFYLFILSSKKKWRACRACGGG